MKHAKIRECKTSCFHGGDDDDDYLAFGAL